MKYHYSGPTRRATEAGGRRLSLCAVGHGVSYTAFILANSTEEFQIRGMALPRRKRRVKKTKAAATREHVYAFAWGCIAHGQPGAAAAAVICFEWFQRPENVLAGYLRWSDYRSEEWAAAIKIEHHKTGAVVWHPLDGGRRRQILCGRGGSAREATSPRNSDDLREVRKGVTKPYSFSGMQKIVHTMRDD